jgi:hypothetical protein
MTTPTPGPTGGPSWTTPGASGQPTDGARGWGQPPAQQPGYGAPVPPPAYLAQPPAVPGGPGAWGQWKPPAVQPGIVPLRPLTLGEILDGSFRAIRSNPSVMFGLSAIVVVVVVGLGAVLGLYVVDLLAATWPDIAGELDPTGAADLQSSLSSFAGSVVSSGIMLFAGPILTGLLITSVSRSVLGQKLSLAEAWQLTKGRRGKLLGFSLLLVVVELVALSALIGLVVVLALHAPAWSAVVAGLIGALAFGVGGVWITVRTLLVPATLVLEGSRFRTGIVRGWKLTYGSFWRLFGIYLLVSLMMGIITSVLQTPAAILSGVLFSADNMQTASIILTSVSAALVNTLTVAYLASVVALLYVDVRIRREGLDVELARAASGAA